MRSRRRRTCRVSTRFDSPSRAVTNTLSLSTAALRGVGAHLLKVGSKRRRKQADIEGQNEAEEIAALQSEESQLRIAQLEQQLQGVQLERDNNANAAQILTQMINDGEAVQDATGAVRVSKSKLDGANLIGNADDY